MNAETYLKQMMARSWARKANPALKDQDDDADKYLRHTMAEVYEDFWENHPELDKLRGTMLEPYVSLYPSSSVMQEYYRLKDKQKKKSMKKLYKIGGWTCLLVGFGCLWGIGAVAVFSGLTLFWFGATIDDAKCY